MKKSQLLSISRRLAGVLHSLQRLKEPTDDDLFLGYLVQMAAEEAKRLHLELPSTDTPAPDQLIVDLARELFRVAKSETARHIGS